MLHVTINIENTTKGRISKSFFKKIVREILRVLKIKKNIEMSLLLVGEKRIRSLNKQYRGQDRVTDVLSFGYLESKRKFITPRTSSMILGDVVICYPQAKKQAKQEGHSTLTEIGILFIHGLLHLLGFDHEEGDNQAKKMMRLEKKIIKKLNL